MGRKRSQHQCTDNGSNRRLSKGFLIPAACLLTLMASCAAPGPSDTKDRLGKTMNTGEKAAARSQPTSDNSPGESKPSGDASAASAQRGLGAKTSAAGVGLRPSPVGEATAASDAQSADIPPPVASGNEGLFPNSRVGPTERVPPAESAQNDGGARTIVPAVSNKETTAEAIGSGKETASPPVVSDRKTILPPVAFADETIPPPLTSDKQTAPPPVASGKETIPAPVASGNFDVPPLFAVGNEAGGQWTVESVLQYALQNHPMLRVRQHEVEIARSKLITAGLFPNPQLVLQTNSSLDSGGDDSRLTTRVMFTIPTGPKRQLRTSVAQAGVRQSQYAMNREVKLLLAEATDAAIEVLYLQELVALERQLAALSAHADEIQKERFKVAAVPYRGVILANLAATNMELALRAANARLDQSQLRLSRAMGLTEATPPTVQGRVTADPLPQVPVTAVVAQARKVAPELAQSQAAIQQSQQRLALERWLAVPDVSLGPVVREAIGNGGEQAVGGRLAMDLPVFDRNQGNIAESAAQIQANCAQLRVAEITTLSDVTAVYLNLKDTESRWQYYSTHTQPVMDQSEAAIREAFRDQTISAYELVELLQQFGRMRLSDLDLRYQHRRLRARLEILLECRLADLPADGPSMSGLNNPLPALPMPSATPR